MTNKALKPLYLKYETQWVGCTPDIFFHDDLRVINETTAEWQSRIDQSRFKGLIVPVVTKYNNGPSNLMHRQEGDTLVTVTLRVVPSSLDFHYGGFFRLYNTLDRCTLNERKWFFRLISHSHVLETVARGNVILPAIWDHKKSTTVSPKHMRAFIRTSKSMKETK